MTDTEYIVGIYHCFDTDVENNLDQKYSLLYILDEKGLLDLTIAFKLYKELHASQLFSSSESSSDARILGPFDSLEQLNQFAFRLCEELNAEKVSLLSVPEYNALLERDQTASAFYRSLLEKGSIMENISRKKKGLLSRFFTH